MCKNDDPKAEAALSKREIEEIRQHFLFLEEWTIKHDLQNIRIFRSLVKSFILLQWSVILGVILIAALVIALSALF